LKYEQALKSEEERVAYQRKLLLCYQRQIREHEHKLLIETNNSQLRNNMKKYEREVEMLLQHFGREASILFSIWKFLW
jgi:hypothetical protein